MKFPHLAISAFVLLVSAVGCGGGGGGDAKTENVVVRWNTKAIEAIRAVKLGPPFTARTLAVVHTCMFDAWAAYDSKAVGTQLGDSLRRPAAEHTTQNKEEAVSFAAYRALVDVYPSQKSNFDGLMTELGYNPANVTTDVTTPAGVANVACGKVLEFRHADGSNQLGDLGGTGPYADYTGHVAVNTPDVVTDPSKWQPLRFANGAAPSCIAPFWRNVIPFSLSSSAQFRTPPPVFGSATYLEEMAEIVELTANLTDEQKVIAEYWADGPASEQPPGHWHLFAQFISARDNHTLDEDVKLFFLLGNAVFDAGIAAWDMKMAYDTSRPITAIRHFYAGQQVRSFVSPTEGFAVKDGSEWLPYQSPNFITPPFPEYTSGHSTFSAAAAEVLRRWTGSDRFGYSVTFKAGSSTFEPGLPTRDITLSLDTFTEAADQAGISRRYGGIHFKAGDLVGRSTGAQVGDAVWDRGFEFIDGTVSGSVE